MFSLRILFGLSGIFPKFSGQIQSFWGALAPPPPTPPVQRTFFYYAVNQRSL